jgi:peptide-methionine (S)-S-oxide reductase
MEEAFGGRHGIASVLVGYAGGHDKKPTYAKVEAGKTGHAEVVYITYYPSLFKYEALLAIFWRNIDPRAKDRQFCDVGNQYRATIFYEDEEQKQLAEASKADLEKKKKFKGKIVTPLVAAPTTFYKAEKSHQNFYLQNAATYWFQKLKCGREKGLKQIWGE